jgi:hypothetical protein
MKYIYDILNWNPINTNSFNLLSKVNIKPDVKLLELFKIAPLHNILCRVQGTDSKHYDDVTYGKIDKSTEDDTYYITLDKIWWSYPDPDKLGQIEFLDQTVFKTIDYITNPNASPIIPFNETPTLNLLYNSENENADKDKNLSNAAEKDNLSNAQGNAFIVTTQTQFCSSPRMKLSDMLIPIGISLVLIGMLSYVLPKKLLK